MWNKPQFFLPSPRSLVWVFTLIIFFGIAVYVLTIGWLDVNEWWAFLIGAPFALALAATLSAWVAQPMRQLARAANEWFAEVEQGMAELKSQHSQAQAILDSMVEGVCALDREGRVLWINRSAERLFSLQPQDATGKRLAELIRQPQVETLVADVLAKQQPETREVQVLGPAEQTIRFQATPCEGAEAAAALVVVAQEVTEVRRLERMRRDFVANVSHELKTPVTSIKGLTETLLGGALEDAANNRRFVTLIDDDATRLTRLIDDLLELSQIESKVAPLNVQPVELRKLFEELEVRFRNQLAAKQVTFELKIPTGLPPVKGDPDKLRQIFVNLLDNAIKFNRASGRVTVTAQPDQGWMHVTVADTGTGIPDADLPRIFERFYRVDKARSRELGGTGLGLAIVKHLAELHQGRVTVASRLGEGSAFTVTLPAHAP
ncbi:MAG: PAS domain-containing protein [Candidatus Omnitrophica bacterium]|nr:PAS domain-containing protein [Candidatus Omnitrophota bacterium]